MKKVALCIVVSTHLKKSYEQEKIEEDCSRKNISKRPFVEFTSRRGRGGRRSGTRSISPMYLW
jgi:hypothetical protein